MGSARARLGMAVAGVVDGFYSISFYVKGSIKLGLERKKNKS